MSKVSYIPKDYNSVTPYLVINGAAQAIEYYKKVFGAIETVRMNGPDGKVGHAELKIGNSHVMLADENPSMGEGHTSATFNEPVTVIYLQPHMHTRGKDMQIRFEYPTGESQTMLNVPHYSYLWQTIYYEQQPLEVPKGTKVDVIAHWDNSANNPLNPDPTKTVRWGDQSWDEMLVPFVGVLVPPNADPATVTSHPRPGPVAAP